MVRFQNPARRRAGGHRPPPNYFSRSVQLRLFVAVGALMLVLVMMWEARKPENWAWMWAGAKFNSENPLADDADKVNTRIPPRTASPERPLGALVSKTPPPDDDPPVDSSLEEDAWSRAQRDAWSRIAGELSHDQRELLSDVLRSARLGSLPTEQRGPWTGTLEKIEQGWSEFLKEARTGVDQESLTDEEKKAWSALLDRMRGDWSSQMRPALEVPLLGGSWTPAQRASLAAVESTLDHLALSAIQDDTVWRPGEQNAWFRLIETLKEQDADALKQASLGPVGFLPLFRQPDEYRGKLVTVRGTARLAYHVEAPKNRLEVTGYYVFWLRPEGGPNSPVVVYALDLPPGFPPIKDKDVAGETTTLNEDLEFTGFFFKRWAYRAQDGLNTAPLLVAQSPIWLSDSTETAADAAPPFWLALASVLAVAALAVVLALFVYRSSISQPVWQPATGAHAEPITLPADLDGPPGVRESLRRLAEGKTEPE